MEKGEIKKIVNKLGSTYDEYYKKVSNKVSDIDIASL